MRSRLPGLGWQFLMHELDEVFVDIEGSESARRRHSGEDTAPDSLDPVDSEVRRHPYACHMGGWNPVRTLPPSCRLDAVPCLAQQLVGEQCAIKGDELGDRVV